VLWGVLHTPPRAVVVVLPQLFSSCDSCTFAAARPADVICFCKTPHTCIAYVSFASGVWGCVGQITASIAHNLLTTLI
jgi:hypothetical protein